MNPKTALLIFSGVIIAIGIAGGAALLYVEGKGEASLAWPSVEGVLLECKVRKPRGKPEVEVLYRYEVNGRSYESGHGTYGDWIRGKDSYAFVESFPIGTRVPVYYDPEDPTRAVLIRGNTAYPWLGWGVMIGAIAMGIGIAFIKV